MVVLGSNEEIRFGGARRIVEKAMSAIGQAGLPIIARSNLYETPCFPKGYGPDYVNAAVLVQTALPPERILFMLHAIENDFQRERAERWGARSLDLDLAAMGGRIEPDTATVQAWIDLPLDDQKTTAPKQLILPHPRLQDRAFVLIPLADIAPDWRHPILGKTIADMLESLPEAEKAAIIRL